MRVSAQSRIAEVERRNMPCISRLSCRPGEIGCRVVAMPFSTSGNPFIWPFPDWRACRMARRKHKSAAAQIFRQHIHISMVFPSFCARPDLKPEVDEGRCADRGKQNYGKHRRKQHDCRQWSPRLGNRKKRPILYSRAQP